MARSQESNPTTTSTTKKVNKISPALESETAQPEDIPSETLGITILLKLPKQEYRVGETIILQEIYTNLNGYAPSIGYDCEPEIPKLHIFVRDESGNSVPLQDEVRVARNKVMKKTVVELPRDAIPIRISGDCSAEALSPVHHATSYQDITSLYKITKPGVYRIVYSRRLSMSNGQDSEVKWFHLSNTVTAVVR
jgi:hypothetical protein